ncbi:MAG: amidohydrolase family protein [Lachnospiraceae bacterium]|nr:amidohydrolase family protein [Lachnospiraceae bacterium]
MVIINGRILTMEDEIIECGYIRTGGNKIEELGSMESYLEKKSGNAGFPEDGLTEEIEEEILDVKGAWVMPGLIEAHAHIGISEEKWGVIADDCNEGTNPVTPYLRALDALNPMDPAFHEAIKAGITSVMAGPGSANVVGGQFLFLKTQGRCVDHMVVKEPAAMKVAFGENPKTAYGDQGKYPSTRMGTAAILRSILFQAVQYKQKKDSGKLEELDFEMEPWIPVLNREIPLKAHAHRADDILTAIRIAKEFGVDMTLDHGTESHLVVDEVKKSGFPVIVGPDLSSRSKLEIQNMNFKTNKVLNEAGILFAITTDHPVSMIGHLPLCAGLAVKYGLPMEDGLKAITINPAKICRVESRVGSLKVGKDADIAIFSGNPMEVFTKTLYTIIDGKIIYQYKED